MALPPWTVELLRRGVQDLARQATDPETAQNLKEQATKLVEELPRVAREKVDTLLKQAEASSEPIREMWRGRETLTGPQTLINGSGTLLHSRGSGVAVSNEALAAASAYLYGDQAADGSKSQSMLDQMAGNIERCCEATDLAVLVLNSIDAALAAIASNGRRGACLLVPRCCAIDMQLPGNDDSARNLLADRLRAFGRGGVRELGTRDGLRLSDLDGVRDEQRSQTLVHLAGHCLEIDRESLSDRGIQNVSVIPEGAFVAIQSDGGQMLASNVVEELNRGADVVVLGGGVLSSTGDVGMVIGRRECLETLSQKPRTELLRVSLASTAIASVGLRQQIHDDSPIQQLLHTSEENLRSRAERLATQLSGVGSIVSSKVTQDAASLRDGGTEAPIGSRQVVIQSETVSAQSLHDRLAGAPVGLLSSVTEEGVAIDLRWISPDKQTQISDLVAAALS